MFGKGTGFPVLLSSEWGPRTRQSTASSQLDGGIVGRLSEPAERDVPLHGRLCTLNEMMYVKRLALCKSYLVLP